ncbi:MAG: hypothetical protein WEC36_12855 [Phycisphaeraceae bacterium]
MTSIFAGCDRRDHDSASRVGEQAGVTDQVVQAPVEDGGAAGTKAIGDLASKFDSVFDSYDAIGAVEKYLLQTRGEAYCRAVIGRRSEEDIKGGRVMIRHRESQGHDTEVGYWAVHVREYNGPYAVYGEPPMHLNHPSVHRVVAQDFIRKAVGPNYNEIGVNWAWSLADRFEDGQSATLELFY